MAYTRPNEKKAHEFEDMARKVLGQNVIVLDHKVEGEKGYAYRLYEQDQAGNYQRVFSAKANQFEKFLEGERVKRFIIYEEIASKMIKDIGFNPPITFDLNPISGMPELLLSLDISWYTYGERGNEPRFYFINKQELQERLARLLTCVTTTENGRWVFDPKLHENQ